MSIPEPFKGEVLFCDSKEGTGVRVKRRECLRYDHQWRIVTYRTDNLPTERECDENVWRFWRQFQRTKEQVTTLVEKLHKAAALSKKGGL